jgi:hypothetical protein
MAALSDNLRTHRWLMRPEQSNEADRSKWSETLGRIRAWVSAEDFRITQHAHQGWEKRALHWIKCWKLFREGKFWKTTRSIVEEPVA